MAAIFPAHFEGSLYGNLGSNCIFQVHAAAQKLRPLDNFGPPGSFALCNRLHLLKQFFWTYPEGKGEFPVGGVSWYEAAAYAEFVGKTLPTVYQWYHAARLGIVSRVLKLSNFSGQGPARVGTYQGLGPFGTYDMAGNVKEWCLNPVGDRRFILGGAWNEPSNTHREPDARRAFDRLPNFGFRLAKYTSPLPDALIGPVPFVTRDRRSDKPADEQAFGIYRNLHSYDKTDLQPVVESVDETSPYWHKERVTLQTAYGNERMPIYLYLPKNSRQPYQTVLFFPTGAAFSGAETPDEVKTVLADFIVRSGRALILPVYRASLERGPIPAGTGPNQYREILLACSKDLRRSIDYLETRPEFDLRKLAYYGHSMGGEVGPMMIAVEPRFKVAVLVSSGANQRRSGEVDSWNFAPHVKIPILMLNGRDDFTYPPETSQAPLFRMLGTPEQDRRYIVYDGGHEDFTTRMDFIKEALDWLEHYLGPVNLKPA